MKTKKSGWLWVMVMALGCAGAPAWAGDPVVVGPDMMVRIGGVLPERSEDWDSAGQADVQFRFWHDEHVGVAVSAGLGGWTARDEYQERIDDYSIVATSVSGDATLVPVGASLLYRTPVSTHVSCILEGGVRYVFVSSGVTATVDYLDATGGYYEEGAIETENFMQGVVGLSMEGSITQPLRLVGSIGYQFDLTDPTERFAGESLGETSFSGAVFSIGLSWDF